MEDTNAPSTPGNAANFTDNEIKLICAIMQNLTSEIQVSESKTPHSHPLLMSARVDSPPSHRISKRIITNPHSPNQQFDVEKVALELGYKNSGSLRARWNSLKRTKIATGGGVAGPAGGVDKSTPNKKAKATPKKAKATNDDEDGEQTPVKKSAVRKAAAKSKKAVKGVKVEVKSEEEENALESIEGSGGRAVTAGVMGDDQGGILP